MTRPKLILAAGALLGALFFCLASAAGAEPLLPDGGRVHSPPTAAVTAAPPTATVVAAGDTLTALAARLGISCRAMAEWNHLGDPDLIVTGEQLRTPPTGHRPPGGCVSRQIVRLAVSPAGAQPVATWATGGAWSGPWACIAAHESGGNPAEDTGNGYYGGLQFALSTWYANGGTGNPAAASIAEQEAVAYRVLAAAGWGQWPQTSRMCGYG